MMRSRLLDSAIAAAKAHAHATVEPRHVVFALARHFRDRPEVGAEAFKAAKARLEPHGSAHSVPTVSNEAESLLAGCGTEEDALKALLASLHAPSGSVSAGSDQAQVAAAPQPLATAPSAAPPPPPPHERTSELLRELDGLVGLASVKAQVRSIIAVVEANRERTKAGLQPVNPGLHLVFTGPPGTGKTTVARLVAKLYASTGALPGSNFTEASRSDLVAGYVGQTAIKTADVIARTRPGVLFIDEAYSLTPTHESDFGAEAIATLVKAMEDHRNEFAVIVAGYGNEMSDFVGSNPGLRSRFKTFIGFPHHGPDELTQIFVAFAQQAGMSLGPGVPEKAREVFRKAAGQSDFGNARFARSLFEQGYARMAARAAADGVMSLHELTEIAVEDLDWKESAPERVVRRIGFGAHDDERSGGY